jgi:hypothetical protein
MLKSSAFLQVAAEAGDFLQLLQQRAAVERAAVAAALCAPRFHFCKPRCFRFLTFSTSMLALAAQAALPPQLDHRVAPPSWPFALMPWFKTASLAAAQALAAAARALLLQLAQREPQQQHRVPQHS